MQTGPRRGQWLLSLLAVGLTVLLGWIVWRQLERADRTRFIAIVAGNHAKLSVPSLPFGHHDLRPLTEQPHRFVDFQDASPLLEAARIGQLSDELKRLQLGKRDTLILYISAHGVANLQAAGQAHLLCRDFDLRKPDQACLGIDQLLQQVADCRAERKLLILDTGYLPTDPRLGLLINEFPRQALHAVEHAAASDVWVLLSNSVLQANTVVGPHSVFGQSVVEGLLGAANTNGDRQIDLAELFEYVAARCQRESAGRQTVQVLQTGVSASAPSRVPQLTLVTLDPARAAPLETAPSSEAPVAPAPDRAAKDATQATTRLTAQTTPEAASAGPSSASSPPAATSSETPAAPRPDEVSPTATPHPPAAETTSATPDEGLAMRNKLDEAWRLRDELQEFSDHGAGWSPLEYAPQLWRELNRLLLDSEMWLLSGPNRSLALQIDKHIEGLRALAASPARPSEVSTVGDLVTDRLRRAQLEFQNSPAQREFQSAAEPLQQVGQDIRRLRRIVYALPEYVRWFGLSICVAPDDDDQLDDALGQQIEQLLTSSTELQHLIRQSQGRPLASALPVQIRDQLQRLEETHRQLTSRLRGGLAQAMARPEVPAFRRKLTVYLQTSLPSMTERQQMRSILDPIAPTLAQTSTPMTEAPRFDSITPVQGQRLMRSWRMEEALLKLAIPDFSLGPPPTSIQDTDRFWSDMHQAGLRLRDTYAKLDRPTELAPSLTSADAMQIIDGRDTPVVTRVASGFPRLGVLPAEVPLRLKLVWLSGSELPVRDQWQDVQLEVATTSPATIPVTLRFEFDESAMQLRTKEGRPIRPGDYPPIAIKSSKALALQVRSAQVVRDPTEGTLRRINVVATSAHLRDEAELQCQLPRPNDVELIATRVGGTEPELNLAAEDQMIQLRLFPNRVTHFRLQLRNVSGVPKSVQVRLLAVPQLPQTDWPPGRILAADQKPFSRIMRSLFEPDGRRLLPNLTMIAQTAAALELPANGQAVDLVLAGAASPAPAEPPPPSAAAQEPTEISAGLLCVVEESTQRWLKWIELQPISPRDYLQVDVAYDLQRLSIDVRPQLPGRLPLGLEQQPIPIAWEIDRLIEEQLGVEDRVETGNLTSENGRVRLYADVKSSRDRLASVRLAVDSVPRAFVFEVPVDRRNEQNDPRRDLPELVVQSVTMSNFPRVYVTSEAEKRHFIAERSADDQRDVVVLQPGQTAAFPKPDVGDQMEIGLRADATVSAFGRSDADDRITVQLTDRLGVPTFQEMRYADRQARFSLVELDGGRIGIRSIVGDHRLSIRPQRMEGDYQLQASMVVGTDELRYPPIPVVFDGQPPRVLRPLTATPTRVEVGKPLEVSFEVADESGLAKIEVGLVKTRLDPLDDQKKVTLDQPQGPLIRLQLATDEPGEFWVKAVVEDRVGRSIVTRTESSFEPVRVQVTLPVAAPLATERPPIVGRVYGFTQIRSRKIDRIEVRLAGDKDFPAVITKNGGEFEFLDVPAGKYRLSAAGYWNGDRVGELPIELKTPSDFRPFTIQLQAKPLDKK